MFRLSLNCIAVQYLGQIVYNVFVHADIITNILNMSVVTWQWYTYSLGVVWNWHARAKLWNVDSGCCHYKYICTCTCILRHVSSHWQTLYIKILIHCNIYIFFRTNPPMKGAFQMLDSWRNPFIVHKSWLFFKLYFFADQMLEFVCVSLFFIC